MVGEYSEDIPRSLVTFWKAMAVVQMFKIVLEPVQFTEKVWEKKGKKGNRSWWSGSATTRTFLEIVEVPRSCSEIYEIFYFMKQLKSWTSNQKCGKDGELRVQWEEYSRGLNIFFSHLAVYILKPFLHEKVAPVCLGVQF